MFLLLSFRSIFKEHYFLIIINLAKLPLCKYSHLLIYLSCCPLTLAVCKVLILMHIKMALKARKTNNSTNVCWDGMNYKQAEIRKPFPPMALISRSYFLQVSATWFSIWEFANQGSFLTETCSAGNTVRVVLLLQLGSWLCIWVMDNCCNFLLGNNKTDMYYCIIMHMFGCSSFPSYFTVKILVTLKQCYQTDIPSNSSEVRKMKWQVPKACGLFWDDWFIMTQSTINSTPPLQYLCTD